MIDISDIITRLYVLPRRMLFGRHTIFNIPDFKHGNIFGPAFKDVNTISVIGRSDRLLINYY